VLITVCLQSSQGGRNRKNKISLKTKRRRKLGSQLEAMVEPHQGQDGSIVTRELNRKEIRIKGQEIKVRIKWRKKTGTQRITKI
jgi:hypothetical protein